MEDIIMIKKVKRSTKNTCNQCIFWISDFKCSTLGKPFESCEGIIYKQITGNIDLSKDWQGRG